MVEKVLLTPHFRLRAKKDYTEGKSTNITWTLYPINMYGVAEELKALGIDVKGMGIPLTEYIKGNDRHLITF